MKVRHSLTLLCAMSGILVLVNGCASPDVNPQASRPGRGYVDLYTQPKTDVWWKLDVFDTRSERYKELAAQFKAPEQAIFRIAARPGSHKARISFVNHAIEAPAELEVEVREGMITPVQVKLGKGDTSYVRITGDRAHSGLRNAVRNEVTDYEQQRWQISATAQPPVAYTPKESTAYWK
jgi:hypothetical protein